MAFQRHKCEFILFYNRPQLSPLQVCLCTAKTLVSAWTIRQRQKLLHGVGDGGTVSSISHSDALRNPLRECSLHTLLYSQQILSKTIENNKRIIFVEPSCYPTQELFHDNFRTTNAKWHLTAGKKISIFIFVTEIVTSRPGSTLILSSHHNAPWTCGSVGVTPTHVYANVYLAESSEFRYRLGEKGAKQKPAPGLAHTAALLQFPFIIAVDASVIGCDLRPYQNVRDVISFYGPSFLQLQASVTHSDYQNELFDTHYARRGKPHMR